LQVARFVATQFDQLYTGRADIQTKHWRWLITKKRPQ
jgi:hypothetical protein